MYYTIEQIKDAIPVDFPESEQRELAELLQDRIGLAEASDIAAEIAAGMEKDAASNPAIAAEIAAWDQMDKTLWLVKQAYIQGAIFGTETEIAANAAGIAELEKTVTIGSRDTSDFIDLPAEIESVETTLAMVQDRIHDLDFISATLLYGLQFHLSMIRRTVSELEIACAQGE